MLRLILIGIVSAWIALSVVGTADLRHTAALFASLSEAVHRAP
jgi:hypothetical protein